MYVWLIDEELMAEMVTLGAHHAIVKYQKNGIEFEVMVEREDFMFIETAMAGVSE